LGNTYKTYLNKLYTLQNKAIKIIGGKWRENETSRFILFKYGVSFSRLIKNIKTLEFIFIRIGNIYVQIQN